MKFSCTKEKLTNSLSIAERFAGKNITLPILGNVLLNGGENNLKIIATNLEYAVQITLSGKGSRSGEVSIPAKVVTALLQSIHDERIDLEEKQGNLYLKTASSRESKINGLPPTDFPNFPQIKKTHTFLVGSHILREALERVLPAVSLSEFKPEFTGIFWNVSGATLYLVATDTFRLAEEKITLPQKINTPPFSFILPHNVAQELTRILGGEESVSVSVGENQVLFETGGVRVISRLIDGNFPEYSAIIPVQYEITSFLNRSELKNAVRASSIFSSKLSEVNLTFQDKILQVSSANPEVGEYKTSIPIKNTAFKKPTAINFNHRYLMDGINSLTEEEIFFGCNSESSPSLLRNRDGDSFSYVVMPIRATT